MTQRKINYEETVRFEQIDQQTDRDLGFEITLIEPGSVPDRVKQTKHVLSLETDLNNI